MSDPISGPNAAAQPIPPRYWWLKRLTLAAIVYLLALVALRLWWGYEADRRLNAKIAEYRAAGQPVLPEDFATEAIPDEENAAYYLRQAVASVDPNDWTLLSELDMIAWDPDQAAAFADGVERLLTRSDKLLALVREARSIERAVWGTPLQSPVINTNVLYFSGQRAVARLVYLGVLARHRTGNDRWAVPALRDLLAHARHIGAEPFVIGHLVRIAVDGLATTAIEDITPSLRIGDDHPHAAEPQEVRALIGELLNEQEFRAGGVRSMLGARMERADTFACLATGRLAIPVLFGMPVRSWYSPARIVIPLLSPALKLDQLVGLDESTAWVRAIGAADWPTAAALLPAEREQTGIDGLLHFVSQRTASLPGHGGQIHFRAQCLRRMAAIALALRLYECEHGRRPDTLSELVPVYLPEVPRDPFVADGRPLRYLPGATSPRLYSVGSNGIDDEGRFALGAGSNVDLGALDLPYFLDGDRPRPRPATQPATSASAPAPTLPTPTSGQAPDDQNHVEDAERNEKSE